jgi:hypothetical protein
MKYGSINEILVQSLPGLKRMFYYEVLESLYHNRVKYLIVGGLAVNLHNVPRMTNDLDIIVSTDKENIANLNKVMKELDYVPRIPENPEKMCDPGTLKMWIDKRNLKAFSFYNRSKNTRVVDIVLVHSLDFEIAYSNRLKKKLKDIDIDLISIDDLILMKKASGRQQDLSDISMLEKVKILLKEVHNEGI